ncbi:hypothetical protein CDAR_254641 [Caerostris darwini]|uniref:Uncharacterized protein n=1 Tax=Caerostris darwini TaxID=1538125 RepID=A0AAV4NBK7_9ARAC|nr:hypothetical protein CDAR_254641 [Caerostris darwini]
METNISPLTPVRGMEKDSDLFPVGLVFLAGFGIRADEAQSESVFKEELQRMSEFVLDPAVERRTFSLTLHPFRGGGKRFGFVSGWASIPCKVRNLRRRNVIGICVQKELQRMREFVLNPAVETNIFHPPPPSTTTVRGGGREKDSDLFPVGLVFLAGEPEFAQAKPNRNLCSQRSTNECK